MTLNDPAVPAALYGGADIGSHIWFRHPAVQDVDARGFAVQDYLFYFLSVVAFQPFRS